MLAENTCTSDIIVETIVAERHFGTYDWECQIHKYGAFSDRKGTEYALIEFPHICLDEKRDDVWDAAALTKDGRLWNLSWRPIYPEGKDKSEVYADWHNFTVKPLNYCVYPWELQI